MSLQGVADGLSDAFLKFLVWVFMPVMAVAVVGIGFQYMTESWAVLTGTGTPGTFVANKLDCITEHSIRHGDSTFCSFMGPFTSTDGRVHFNVAEMNGSPHGMKPGDSAAAIYTGVTGPPPQVFGKGNLADFGFGVALAVGGVAVIGLWVFLMIRRRSRTRHSR